MNLDFSPEQQIERQGRFEKQSSYGTQEVRSIFVNEFHKHPVNSELSITL